MATQTTTETGPARFALDEGNAAEWLGAYMADQEIGPPRPAEQLPGQADLFSEEDE